jgi:hypothetical protein
MPGSKILYIRVSDELHTVVSAYADHKALTLTGAVKELLQLGVTGDSLGWRLVTNLERRTDQ